MKASMRASRKVLRLLPLVLLSSLITFASAAVYNLMFLQAPGVGVEAPKVYFIEGSDSGTACTVTIGTNMTWARISNMKGWPNATRIYENATAIRNADNDPRNVTLSFDLWSGDTSNVTIAVKVYDSTDTQKGNSISVGTPGSNTGIITIPAGENFRVQWDITWNAGSLSAYSVSVRLSLRVNE